MVAVTRATAAGIAILCALNNVAATGTLAGDASSNEARDLVDSEPTLDARDLADNVLESRDLMEDADAGLDKRYPPIRQEVLKKFKHKTFRRSLNEELEERDFDDALYERDFDDISPLEIRAIMDGSHPDAVVINKRIFKFLKTGLRMAKGLVGMGRSKNRRSLDEELEERDFDGVLYERDFDDISPLEIRAIMDGSHPDAVVINKRIFKFLKTGLRMAKGLIGGGRSRNRRSLDEELSERDFDEDLDERDFDEDLDERDFDDDSLLEARDVMDDISDYFETRGIEESDAVPDAPGPKGFRKGPKGPKGPRPGAKGFRKGAKGLRPGAKGFRKGAQGLRPGAKGFRKGAQGLRPGAKGFRKGAQGLRPGAKGFRKGAQGLRPGAKGLRPGLKGLRPGLNGLRPGAKAFRKGPKSDLGGVPKADS